MRHGDEVRTRPVLLVVGVGTLLSALAGSAVTVALPRIGHEFGLTIASTRWVMLAYLLAVTVLLLPVGRAGDLAGLRRIYLGGFMLFGVMSLVCGLAPRFDILIVGRVLQGVGGAMIMATGPALLTTTVPGTQRGRALGLVATATYTGLTVGPTLGGILVATLGWRWVFFLMVPVTAAVVAIGVWLLQPSERRSAAFDWAGAAALVVGFTPLLLAISQGEAWGWTARPTVVAAAGGLLVLLLFLSLERRRAAPLLDLRLFHSRVFDAAVISALCNYVALFVPILLLPFYLIEGLGLGSDRAGLLLSVQPLVMAGLASPAGWLSDRIGSRSLATVGMAVLAAGLWGLSGVDASTSHFGVAAWLALLGAGTGIFISPNSNALMGAAPRTQQGVAGGVLAVSRNLGMLLGVATATALFQAAGGRTGQKWHAADFSALGVALQAAAGVAALGAVAALLAGRVTPPGRSPGGSTPAAPAGPPA